MASTGLPHSGRVQAGQRTECDEKHDGRKGVEPESPAQGHGRESYLEHEEDVGRERPDDMQGVG
jgi:hypothetical protein